MAHGYSGTPLAKKLGIKAGSSLYVWNSPQDYLSFFTDFPDEVRFPKKTEPESLDLIHAFFTSQKGMEEKAQWLKNGLKKNGMLWVSWPKGSSSIPTDLKREPIREHFLSIGLVDVKVAAVNEDWSGLKFMYRIKDR